MGYSARVGRLSFFPRYNRFGMANQVHSTYKLLDMGIEIKGVLPGHGRPFYPESREQLVEAVDKAVREEQ